MHYGRLREQLRTLRRLPTDTRLYLPVRREERQLLHHLVRLPDDTDPLQSLQGDLGGVTARTALHSMLEELRSRSHVQRRARRLGEIPEESEQLLLGHLWRLPKDAAPFSRLRKDVVASETELWEVLRQVRALRGLPPVASFPLQVSKGSDRVLVDLLQLPEHINPVEWLQDTHRELIAWYVLRNLLCATAPPRGLAAGDAIGKPLHRLRPRVVIRDDNRVRVSVDRVILSSHGFLVDLNVWLSAESEVQASDTLYRDLVWLGFDRVSDNRGYHYLLQDFESDGVSYQRLRMTFYPAVAQDATELSFASMPAMVLVSTLRIPEGPVRQPELNIGDIVWRMRVPGRAE